MNNKVQQSTVHTQTSNSRSQKFDVLFQFITEQTIDNLSGGRHYQSSEFFELLEFSVLSFKQLIRFGMDT